MFFNRRVDGTPSQVSVTIHELGMLNSAGYRTEDVFAGQSYGVLFPADRLKVDVNPSGVVLVRCSAVAGRAFSRPPQQQLQRGRPGFFTTTRPRFF